MPVRLLTACCEDEPSIVKPVEPSVASRMIDEPVPFTWKRMVTPMLALFSACATWPQVVAPAEPVKV